MKRVYPVILLSLSTLLLRCGEVGEVEDLEAVEAYPTGLDYPYLRSISKNGVVVSVRYRPTDALMLHAYRGYLQLQGITRQDVLLSREQRQARLVDERDRLLRQRASYDQALYFQLTIGYEDASRDLVYSTTRSDHGTVSRWLQTLAFGLQEHVTLRLNAAGEVPLATYHMEQTYGLTRSRTFLLVFPAAFQGRNLRSMLEEGFQLKVEEFGLGTGPLTFSFAGPPPAFRQLETLLLTD